MIGTRGATMVMLVYLIFTSAVGVSAGGLTCLVFRRAWGLKTALIDAVLAAVVAIVAALVVSAIDSARGVFESRVGLVVLIATGSVVVSYCRPFRKLLSH